MIYFVGKYALHLPSGHKLPEYQKQELLYDKGFIPVISECIAHHCKGKYVLDIGANVGDSAALYSFLGADKIISIEGAEEYLPFLKRNTSILTANVDVIEQFLYLPIINKLGLRFLANDGTGSFSNLDNVKDQKYKTSELSFIHLEEIENKYQEGVGFLKTDTDGLDIHIVDLVMERSFFHNTIINMEFSPNYSLVSPTELDAFVRKLEERYSVICFDNKGAPLFFKENGYSDILLDLLRYLEFSKAHSHQPFQYYDLFLFPKNTKATYELITEQYRNRKAI